MKGAHQQLYTVCMNTSVIFFLEFYLIDEYYVAMYYKEQTKNGTFLQIPCVVSLKHQEDMTVQFES